MSGESPKNPAKENRESCRVFKSAFEHAGDPIFLLEKGIFVECNREALLVFGCKDKEEIIGKTPFDFSPQVQPDGEPSVDKGQALIRKAIEGTPQRFEWLHHRMDGEQFFAEVSLNRIDVGGSTPTVIAIVRDISVRKGLERQLAHAQRMEAVGVLAAGMAHDFNNMLGAIMGNLNLISLEAEERGSFEKVLQYASNAEKVVTQAAQVTKRLLAFTRQSNIQVRDVDPLPVVEDTIQLLKRTIDRRISVNLEAAEQPWMVRADGGELQQILMNLCINAMDTLKDRIEGNCGHARSLQDDPPAITLRVENSLVDDDHVSRYPFARKGRFVAFSVRDNGCGMDEKTLSRIFDPFFTTKGLGRGTGLGLAMVYGLVKQHKGWIIADSTPGEGTTFVFYIPAVERPETVREEPRDERPLHSREKGELLILLAEDEKVISDVCSTMLTHLGHRVVLAYDGQEAVRAYQENRPDMVFLDITMPRLSGEEVLRLILDHDPDARVVISSGHPRDTYAERLLKMGAILYLQKPYRIKEVKEAIEKAMGD